MTIALLCMVAKGAWAEDVNYIYYKAVDVGNQVSLNKFNGTASNPTELTSKLISDNEEDRLYDGWYVLNSSFTYGERIVIYGDVHLILKNGCTLTAEQGIRINTDATLSIYAQSEEETTMGKLVAIETHHDKAAIGGNKNYQAGKLFIHGGNIEATCKSGSKYAAGIGGGYGDGSGWKDITIYGGKVTAQGAYLGAGIGSGKNNKNSGTITIYGGKVKATGDYGGAGIGGGDCVALSRPVRIHGGTIVAEGYAGAGIGAGSDRSQGALIEITGGDVTAIGRERAAAIGGGDGGNGGEVRISGGKVKARGHKGAAGIGGGKGKSGGSVFISGGDVTAICYADSIGHNTDVDGGSTMVGSHQDGGAAIGGGYEGDGGTIVITGGNVKAYANTPDAKGLGGGEGCKSGGNITITGGTVFASAEIENKWGRVWHNSAVCNKKTNLQLGDNYRVWVGNTEKSTSLVPSAERTTACKENRVASFEPCDHAHCTYTYINESSHSATCKFCKYNTTEEHSIVAPSTTCDKCGYSNGATICTLAFPETSTAEVSGYETAGFQAVQGRAIAMPACTKVPEGWTFVGWLRQSNAPSSIEAADSEGTLWQPGSLYIVEGDEIFFARYRYDFTETWTWDDDLTTASLTIQAGTGEPISVEPVTIGDRTETAATAEADGSITATATATYTHGNTTYTFSTTQTKVLSYNLSLGEDDNTEALTTYDGRSMNVTLTGRTLYKDGKWNTLCLPFDIAIEGSPLAGATVKELTDASFADGTLTLTFADATSIEAGQAYLIKWDIGTDLEPSDLVFTGVTLTKDLYEDEISTDDNGTTTVTFMGTYKKLSYDADDRSILLLGANNKLYYPQSGASLGAQRAYFKLSGITAGDKAAGVRAFVLDFGDGEEATGIGNLTVNSQLSTLNSDTWYTLDGRRLSAKPTQKGIYINNGHKIVME